MSFKEKLTWYFSERGWFAVLCLFGIAITMVILNLIVKMIFDFELQISNIDSTKFENKIRNRMLRYALIEIGVSIFIYIGLIIKDYLNFFKNKY